MGRRGKTHSQGLGRGSEVEFLAWHVGNPEISSNKHLQRSESNPSAWPSSGHLAYIPALCSQGELRAWGDGSVELVLTPQVCAPESKSQNSCNNLGCMPVLCGSWG